MSEKANPDCRAAVVKTIDKLFYEERNHKRCHVQIFRRCIHPLYGICKATWQNYRKLPDAVAECSKLPDELLYMFRNYLLLAREMPPLEVAKALRLSYLENALAIRRATQAGRKINADALREFRLTARDGATPQVK